MRATDYVLVRYFSCPAFNADIRKYFLHNGSQLGYPVDIRPITGDIEDKTIALQPKKPCN